MSTREVGPNRRLLLPAEVAEIFRVEVSTVNRWAKKGKLEFIRTAGGHRRYFEDQVLEAFLESQPKD